MITHKLWGVLFCVLTTCMVCFGQTSFQGLTPGISTRSDVARALGEPVRTISATLFEYSPPAGIAKVEVGYSGGSSLIERIEVYFLRPISRSALVQKLSLPAQAEAQTKDAEGKLVEYFGGSSLLALVYAAADTSSGVTRMGYYSRELFESALPKMPGARQNPGTPSGSSRSGSDAGIALTDAELPAYMRPPAGGSAASVDRTGRASPPGDNSGSKSGQTKRTTTTTESPDFVITRSEGEGKIHLVGPTDAADTEIRLSVADLRRLVGRYEFMKTSMPGWKLAEVTLDAGKLELTIGAVNYTLVPIGRDDMVVSVQGDGDTFNFKVAGKPGIEVVFNVSGGKIESLLIVEEQRKPMGFSVAVPKP